MKTFTATVKNRNIKVHQSVEFASFMQDYESKDVKFTIGELKERDQRSIKQNKYYWGVIVKEIADYCGESIEDTHKNLKLKFFSTPKQINKPNGKTFLFLTENSTTEYNTKEFEEKCEEIRLWANDPIEGLDLNIPKPNEDIKAYDFIGNY